MAERWFLALWPDDGTRRAIDSRVSPCIPPGVRSTHPDDLHLTLAFLGELTSGQIACVEAAAARAHCPDLILDIDRIGHFARSRVLWCGPSQEPTALLQLVRRLRSALAGCGLEPEARPHRSHLTVARKVRDAVARPLETPIQWEPRELVLAHGVAGVTPRYRIHRRWPLREPPSAD